MWSDEHQILWFFIAVIYVLWNGAFLLSAVLGFFDLIRGIQFRRLLPGILGGVSLFCAGLGFHLLNHRGSAGPPFYLCLIALVCSFSGWRKRPREERGIGGLKGFLFLLLAVLADYALSHQCSSLWLSFLTCVAAPGQSFLDLETLIAAVFYLWEAILFLKAFLFWTIGLFFYLLWRKPIAKVYQM